MAVREIRIKIASISETVSTTPAFSCQQINQRKNKIERRTNYKVEDVASHPKTYGEGRAPTGNNPLI